MTDHRRTFRARTLSSLAAVTLSAFALAGCGPTTVESAPPAATAIEAPRAQETNTPAAATTPSKTAESKKPAPAPKKEKPAAKGTALALLETTPVKGRAPKTGYDRDEFGSGWQDPDRNGCDARNDILARDLVNETFRPGTNNCIVTSGTLADPFTATTIRFVRGNATSTAVQIDHVIPLSLAWQTGAQQLAPNQREAFANDPLNLLAVDGPTNGSKSDSDAATWLPPNRAFRCEYVALQTAVKAKYKLWMTSAEKAAIARVLSSCPDQPVPDDDGGVTVPLAAKPKAEPKAAPEPETPALQEPAPGGDIFYQNCSAVKAAGKAPIRAGDPGWEPKFDRDGDGLGCES
ncbi:GmrSD restriction endonuclease domain-containing protein [Arthrobacter mobilis]|uniref:DUF1524 domain-containing protein n=1 Tax=Arthrobacter mobilis TaxID=2724944 RepID=A0A7X6HE18_9MICC|nr:DUF1524 domain-containing protein [Arthrobacter mobilis]NKX55291.1 DUF1524 domain-containing protein [Arthrobacter mobilis]